MSAFIHDVPGRLRVKSPSFKSGPRLDAAERVLAGLAGVTSVKGRPLTGSLLVHYDPTRLSGDRIKTILRRDCGVDCHAAASLALDERVERFCHQAGDKLCHAGANLLVDAALKSVGLSFLGALI